MQDLRVRFGILLAIIFLPFVLFLEMHESVTVKDRVDRTEVKMAALFLAEQPQLLSPSSTDEILAAVDKKSELKLTLFDEDGRVVYGPGPKNLDEMKKKSSGSLADGGEFVIYEAADGDMRRAFLIKPENSGSTIAVSTPKISIWDWKRVNPLDNILLPLLAWAVGFTAIWFAVDQLIVTHLRKIAKVSAAYELGDRSIRVGPMINPPSVLRKLGLDFDRMADDVSSREAALVDALDEKETLLREIHHRVKNNLQIITSLLNMQERRLSPEEPGYQAIADTKSRINAIALVHRGLYESADLRFVDMNVFISRLMSELKVAMGLDAMDVDVDVSVNCDAMEADTAIPIALFFVEGLTNAVKYGVGQGGTISIAIDQDARHIEASVKDDATSKTQSTEPITKGTGSRIIEGIARQLRGQILKGHHEDGFVLSLSFDLPEITKSK